MLEQRLVRLCRAVRSFRLAMTFGCIIGLLPASVGAATEEPQAAEKPAEHASLPAKSPSGSVFVDPLGFALFGPTFGVELGLGNFSAIAFGRWFNAGVLARSMFLTEDDEFAFSFGAGLKGRYYFNSGLVGPHLGVACEVLKTRAVDEKVSKTASNNLIVVPQIEGGYRLGLGQFFLGGTVGVGYAAQVKSSIDNVNGGTSAQLYTTRDYSTVYASANIDLGLFF